jgi:hypothetical protein
MSRHDTPRRDVHPAAMPRDRGRPQRMVLRVSGFVADYLIALPVGCVVALVWVNTLPESYFRFANATAFFVNEIGIVFFFALIAKEVVEATLPGGPLHPWRRAALPVVTAVGGVIGSIACYIVFVQSVGEPMLRSGWVAACAIDIPMVYLIARAIFGRHPAVPFLLLLAICADAIGLALVAVLQPIGEVRPAVAVGLMVVALCVGLPACGTAASRTSGCTSSAQARFPGGRCSWAVSTQRSLSCRSCRFFPTENGIAACWSSRRQRRTIR